MKKTAYALSFALWSALLLSACGGADNAPAQDARPVSVATPTVAGDSGGAVAVTASTSAPRPATEGGQIDPRAFTPTTIAEVAPTPAPGSGGLIDMEVAIEAPPEMAGVTKLSSLNIIPPFAGFAICSFRTTATPFMLMFAVPPGQNPPTPVATFQFVASAAVTPNQPTPANFEVGLFKSASEDPQMFAGDGVIIVAGDGKSGTFETRRMKGRWSCTFAE